MSIFDFKKISNYKKGNKLIYNIRKLEFLIDKKLIKSKNEDFIKTTNKLKNYCSVIKDSSKLYNTSIKLINCLKSPKISSLSKIRYEIMDICKISYCENDFENYYNFNSYNIDKMNFNISVLLSDIRSPFNIGSIIRSSECFGFKKVFLYGISNEAPQKKISKSSKFAENFLDIVNINDNNFEETIKTFDYIIGIETGKDSSSLNTIHKENLSQFSNILIIMGNEEFGISEELKKHLDKKIIIPMIGNKNSLNVSNAFAIIAYKFLELNYEDL